MTGSECCKQHRQIEARPYGGWEIIFHRELISLAVRTFDFKGGINQLAVINLAGTDIDMKNRYEDTLNDFCALFIRYKDVKQKVAGDAGSCVSAWSQGPESKSTLHGKLYSLSPNLLLLLCQ
jgi:hypothetical protein